MEPLTLALILLLALFAVLGVAIPSKKTVDAMSQAQAMTWMDEHAGQGSGTQRKYFHASTVILLIVGLAMAIPHWVSNAVGGTWTFWQSIRELPKQVMASMANPSSWISVIATFVIGGFALSWVRGTSVAKELMFPLSSKWGFAVL